MINLSDVSFAHGTDTLFEDVSLQINPRSRIALVGANGAGKTTLLEVMAGLREPEGGTVQRLKGTTFGYLRQDVAEGAGGTPVERVVAAAGDVADLERRMRELEVRMGEVEPGPELDELVQLHGQVHTRFDQLGGYGLDADVRRVLAGLGFSEEEMDREMVSLSGGWMMRVELAALLVSRPDVLLLDEPTNHLDLASVTWLEGFLKGFPGAVVLVSHDRDFMEGIAEEVVEIAFGTATSYTGSYSDFVEQREARLEQLRSAAANQQRRIDQLERFIERFRYKNTLASRVQSKIKMLEKMDRVDVPEEHRAPPRFRFPDPPRSGRDVILLEDVHKAYGDNVVYEGLDLVIERGQKVALVGPNGAGKSTLLRILAGVEPIDGGSRELGHNVEVAYYAQHQIDALDPDNTVLQELTRVVDTRRVNPRSMLGAFRFSGDEVDKRVRVLSGGEKSRLALCKLLAEPVNLLCMDEPTNHLDIPSRDVVEDALDEYPGTVVLITHDRHLLRSIADTVIEIRDGRVTVFPGGFEYYLDKSDHDDAEVAAEEPDDGVTPAQRDADRKRREAEARNRMYRATKDARDRLGAVEAELSDAEGLVARLNRELADPGVYEDQARVKELVEQHGRAKDRAKELYEEWERLTLEVERATERAERRFQEEGQR
ncbi:MAG: ABC-F family ATP-binding cassette domain-containing protein [Actinobacteria bacterium]|nr:ABC-F family ATP-binding cassette domain-containing protein [Actinomycetota bacterium]